MASPSPALSNSTIVAAYLEKTPGSAALAVEAADAFPSGITHDSRHLEPYGMYVERAEGAHKWDVDGNEYIDYFGGHGALLLGHNHPEVAAAIHQAMDRGSHFGANHPYEVRWAQAVKRLMPGVERLRFTSSGTEATHLALRLARAHTGRSKVVRLDIHFHGWHDHMTGSADHHGAPGVLSEITENVVLVPPGDVDALAAALAGDDVAAVIFEPTGAYFGVIPLAPDYLFAARRLTEKHGTVLVFDEVVTGFRVSPGGAQGHYGVTPDLTALAKILAGGLPGGAVAGRTAILDRLDFAAAQRDGAEKIQHQGTFNANPVSAAAGIAALGIIATTDACDVANASAATLRGAFNEVLADAGMPWAAYGEFSSVHVFTNPQGLDVDPLNFDPFAYRYDQIKREKSEVVRKLRLAMVVHGVDLSGAASCLLSAVHSADDLAKTTAAFRASLAMLKDDGEI